MMCITSTAAFFFRDLTRQCWYSLYYHICVVCKYHLHFPFLHHRALRQLSYCASASLSTAPCYAYYPASFFFFSSSSFAFSYALLLFPYVIPPSSLLILAIASAEPRAFLRDEIVYSILAIYVLLKDGDKIKEDECWTRNHVDGEQEWASKCDKPLPNGYKNSGWFFHQLRRVVNAEKKTVSACSACSHLHMRYVERLRIHVDRIFLCPSHAGEEIG